MLAIPSRCFYNWLYGKAEMLPYQCADLHCPCINIFSYATVSWKREFLSLLQCIGHINFLDKVVFLCLVRRSSGTKHDFCEARKVSYDRTDLVNITYMPVLHLLARVQCIHSGNAWCNPQTTSCTMTGRRWHRSPTVGLWKHHSPMAGSGRHPGEDVSLSAVPPKGTAMLPMCRQISHCFPHAK